MKKLVADTHARRDAIREELAEMDAKERDELWHRTVARMRRDDLIADVRRAVDDAGRKNQGRRTRDRYFRDAGAYFARMGFIEQWARYRDSLMEPSVFTKPPEGK